MQALQNKYVHQDIFFALPIAFIISITIFDRNFININIIN